MIHGTMYGGYTLIAMSKFSLEDFCKLVQDHKATFAYLVPPVALLLSKHPVVDKYDLSSLRMTMSGAAPMTRELAVAMCDRIKVPIKQAYGLTETSPGAIVQVSLVFEREGCLNTDEIPAVGRLGQVRRLRRSPLSQRHSEDRRSGRPRSRCRSTR
jgi:acyl-CoA synthetase (AMP-forming)/AMP-acid ligase II